MEPLVRSPPTWFILFLYSELVRMSAMYCVLNTLVKWVGCLTNTPIPFLAASAKCSRSEASSQRVR